MNTSVNPSISVSRPIGSSTVRTHAASTWRHFYAFRTNDDHLPHRRNIAEVIRNPAAQAGVIDRLMRAGVESSEGHHEMVRTIEAVREELERSNRMTLNPGSRIVDLLRSYVVGLSFVSWIEVR
jgi:hypothetical protein